MRGVVYSETTVHSAPAHMERDAPYQLAIVDMEDGKRVTGRVDLSHGVRAAVGDEVIMTGEKDRVAWFTVVDREGLGSPEDSK
jgi:uncharacterized OB-fold protein